MNSRRNMPTRRWRTLAASCVLAATLGCGGSVTAPGFGPVERMELLGDGLVQSVRVEVSAPLERLTLRVTSKVRNIGTERVTVLAYVCDLGIESDLTLTHTPESLLCRGLPPQVDLAPGDSLVLHATRFVGETGGRHTIRVQHLLEPSRRISLSVQLPPGS